jgi:hypothetical protein
MKYVLRFSLSLFVFLTLAGCASSPIKAPMAGPVVTGRPVSLDTILVATSSAAGDLEPEKQVLGDAIISGLNDSKMFTTVTGNESETGAANGIKIQADIREIKKVSNTAREWTGALAGRARILVRVTVSDLKSGDQIEVFDAVGQSGQSAFAGTTDEAIQRAAQHVVAEVLSLNSQSSQ